MKRLIEATATPLASIFGSGFLVIVPILAGAVGSYSILAMAGICAFAYIVGNVIRFNIANAEPALANKPSEMLLSLERISDLALILAYVISVCLYLRILSAFVLGGLGADNDLNEQLLTTSVIAVIVAIGIYKGLEELEVLERWALFVTLIVIAVVMIAFGNYVWSAWQSAAGIILPHPAEHSIWNTAAILGGTLIVVQGFETPRYLGKIFDAKTRISASRLSQIIAAVVYIIFVSLALPLVHELGGKYNDNSLIALVGFASALLVAPLIIAAALSQFSAAVADTLSATGNLEELTQEHLKERFGYIFVGVGAIVITWSADTYQVLALASRAFAFYYMMQCFVAMCVSRTTLGKTGLSVVAIILGFVTVFAIPAG